MVAAILIWNLDGQSGLYNKYLFIKSDKILDRALKQDWDNRNTHWKIVRN